MSKLLENIFRSVNIALVNELKVTADDSIHWNMTVEEHR
jgi:UDP-N-acetyl-D-mannosaminuronate dehydrogenase